MKTIALSLLFLYFFLINSALNAQELTGTIVDERNQPLAYTTIYIEELKTGFISNEKGVFSFNLKEGSYHIRFQHLGYQTKTQQVKIPNENALSIQMAPVSIELKEVTINAKGEDPAYNIVRKAITKAPYYESLLSYYKSDIYSKEVTRFSTEKSKFIRRLEKWMKDTVSGLGEIIELRETVYDITYTPQKTEQIAEAISKYLIEDSNSVSIEYTPEFRLSNIYNETGWISPISSNALSYYNYELINSIIIDGNKVYHIRVIPKKKNNTLLSGTIDIIDSLWCIYHFDLEGKAKVPFMSVDVRFRQMFSELEKNVWLPVNYLSFTSVMLGIKVEITQTGSIQYKEYKINDFKEGFIPQRRLTQSIDTSSIIVTDKYLKIQEEISKLSEKEELSKKDMLKMMNLMRKGTKELKKNNKELFMEEGLELIFDNQLLIEEGAYERDTVYWNRKRIIPFTQEETDFIKKIKAASDSLSLEGEMQQDSIVQSNDVNILENEILGQDIDKEEILKIELEMDSVDVDSSHVINNQDLIHVDTITFSVEVQQYHDNIDEKKMDLNIDTIQVDDLSLKDTNSSTQEERKLIKAPSYRDILDSMMVEERAEKHYFYLIGYRININRHISLDFRPAYLDFNPVDGFSVGLRSTLKTDFGKQRIWKTDFDILYTFKSRNIPMLVSSTYEYLPGRMGYISLNAGRISTDFNNETGVNSCLNEFSTLYFKRSYINYYDRKFIDFTHSIEAFNGFIIDADFKYEQQKQLHNNTNYSFFRRSKEYKSNIPDNPYILGNGNHIENNSSSIVRIKLTYTPRMKYTYIKNKKVNTSSNYPTISISFQKGINGLFNGTADFERWEATIDHRWDLGKFSSITYQFTGGVFPRNENMHFSQFKHFGIYEFPLMNRAFDNNFHTLETYSTSTNEWYLSGFVKYKAGYLLLKHLPFLEEKNMNENLFLSYLNTPQLKNYTEIGYAITDIYMIGSIGAFVGFENFKYNRWGVKISLSFPWSK